MEFYVELFLTAVISIFFAFIIGKLAAAGGDGIGRSPAEAADLKADPVPGRDRKVEVLAEDKTEKAEDGQGFGCEAVDDGRPREPVLVSDRIETGEVREEIGERFEEERSVEDSMEKAEEVRAGEIDVEKEKGESGRGYEVIESGLEETSVGKVNEKTEIEKIDADSVKEEERFAKELRLEETLVQEINEKVEIERIEAELVKEEERFVKGELSGEQVGSLPMDEVSVEKVASVPPEEVFVEKVASLSEEVVVKKEEKEGSDEKVGSLLHGEDEWEGIEPSELGKLFGRATAFTTSENGGAALSRLGSNEQMQLYGLHKVATEGPCYEPQPMALKVSSRAKWHAWQRLGNMNPEVAMEQYINLLSEKIPEWVERKPGVAGEAGTGTHDSSSSLSYHPSAGSEGSLDDSCIEHDSAAAGSKLSQQGLTKAFLFNLLCPTRVTILSLYW